MPSGLKDPDDEADYKLLWANNLGSDTISASEWILPAGITQESDSHTDTTATVRLSGGTAGQQYEITNRVDTASGQQFDQSITIYVRHQ